MFSETHISASSIMDASKSAALSVQHARHLRACAAAAGTPRAQREL
jgi:hypothetical protein